MLKDKLLQLRAASGMTLEQVAERLNVTRQSVQKWENGKAEPSSGKLVKLSGLYKVTTDYLIKDDALVSESGRIGNELLPTYDWHHDWEAYYKTLPTEYMQCMDEGKDVGEYEALFKAVASLPNGKDKADMSDILFRMVSEAPIRKDYPFDEPSDLDGIRAQSVSEEIRPDIYDKKELFDRAYGGWLGRICGCYLGKPIEGIRRKELLTVLERTANYPMTRYICREELSDEVMDGISFPLSKRAYPRDFGKMSADDDTNYIVVAYKILEKYGREFTSQNVVEAWIDLQPKNAYCTAERVAYRNFVNGFLPPDSAVYKNSFREWIGAQIRGDFYGYVCPSDPEKAAEFAYRDARVSHVKNGIYGEMWVSAMIAAAFGLKSIKEIILCGLQYIPAHSRLYAAIKNIVECHDSGMSEETCFESIRTRWDENVGHHWCHTISNAEIVAASLLYGDGDYTKSVCLAAMQAFDTDCNAATVGSVLGVLLGAKRLPKAFTNGICDTLETTVMNVGTVSVQEMAKKTLNFIE